MADDIPAVVTDLSVYELDECDGMETVRVVLASYS